MKRLEDSGRKRPFFRKELGSLTVSQRRAESTDHGMTSRGSLLLSSGFLSFTKWNNPKHFNLLVLGFVKAFSLGL